MDWRPVQGVSCLPPEDCWDGLQHPPATLTEKWAPTLLGWSAAGGVAVVHFTDWRLILDYVPYINGKFKKDE
uniref:Cytochrome b-c1 complex subunit 10 n=1 Tax=Pygocentrus nattereri TaxID=42514 RepID=A0A3B4E5L2_PYGNA